MITLIPPQMKSNLLQWKIKWKELEIGQKSNWTGWVGPHTSDQSEKKKALVNDLFRDVKYF